MRATPIFIACASLSLVTPLLPAQDAGEWKSQATLRAHTTPVTNLVFLADGKGLATAGYDGGIRLWEVPSGKQSMEVQKSGRDLATLALSADGKTLGWVGRDARVTFWDVEGRKVARTARLGNIEVGGAGFAPDFKALAFSVGGLNTPAKASGPVHLWDLAANKATGNLRGHTEHAARMVFTPDAKVLYTTGTAYLPIGPGQSFVDSMVSQLKRWELPAGKETVVATGGVNAVTLSADGKTLAYMYYDKDPKKTGAVIHDVATGKQRSLIPVKAEEAVDLALSPDGSLLAVGCVKQVVQVWDVASGKKTATLKGHRGYVQQVRFSPDGKWLASGENDGTVILWSAAKSPSSPGNEKP